MLEKRTVLPALALLLPLMASCDKGGPKLPVENPFEGSVQGVVRADEATLTGVQVRLAGSVIREVQTDASGEFSFPGLPAGDYVVSLTQYPDQVEFTVTSKPASIGNGHGSATVQFQGAVKCDASILGSVMVAGEGMPGVTVSLSGPEARSATTDSQGGFQFAGLKRGVYTMILSGFDPAFYAFAVTQQTIPAESSTPVEATFTGTLVPQPPLAPSGLTAQASGAFETDLGWTDESDDETRFEIDRRRDPEGSWSILAALDPDTTSFHDLGLEPATTYSYRVRACNDAGCSLPSGVASVTTDDVPPEAPSDLQATPTGPHTIQLQWTDQSGNESRFEVEVREGESGDWSPVGTTSADVSSFQDSDLTPGSTFSYRVRACNAVGCSAFTPEAEATTDQVPPEAPLELEAAATGSTSGTLAWIDASHNETRFEVERKGGGLGVWVPVASVSADQVSFDDGGLTPNSGYTYRVRACNEVGCSPWSNEAGILTEEIPPDAPVGLAASATGSATTELSWTDQANNEGEFRVERKGGLAGSWSQVGTTGANGTDFQDTGLSPATTYVYRVRACNDVGCSSYSNQASTTTDPVPPEPPYGLSADATGQSTVDLEWTDGSGNESRFEVDRREGASGSWSTISTPGPNTVSLGDTGLSPGTVYHYRVRACNAAGCSPYSGEAQATTYNAPPEAPTGLSASATGTTTITLAWTDASDNESFFRIERKEEPGGLFGQVGSRQADVTTFGDAGLSPGTTYTYRVTACNGGGCSPASNQAQATTWNAPPTAPTDLAATATGPGTIDLAWTDGSGNETGFRVERKEGGGGAFAAVGSVGADVTSFADLGLSPNTLYVYRVVAFNASGDSDPSGQASATTWAASGPNLTIANLYLTQSTQTLGGAVPLVADRDGYLRVFAVASEANSLQPSVRVRFYLGGSLAHTETLPAPGGSVPTSVDESPLAASWNVGVPGTLIQPGLTILADVDPGDAIPESNEADNLYPVGGSPLAMDVRTASPFRVTFVPVRQSVNDEVGNVTAGNVGQYMDVTLRMLPISEADVQVHGEYVTNTPVLQSNDGNGAWQTILGEVNALRVAEGTSRYYYGVVHTTYGSGIAGMGFLGWPTAIGWDHLPSGSGVAAHEWGHNWDLRHAPGCGAGNPDPAFPYAQGKIGVWGLDLSFSSLKSPSTHYDFMSYCGPDWISDYHYEKILEYREIWGSVGGSPPPEPSLLVWGRVEGDALVLEPSFQLTTAPALPSGDGEYLLEGFDGDGTPLFRAAFQPVAIPDAGPGDGHFAFAIPTRLLDPGTLQGLRVSGGGATPATMLARVGPQMAAPPEPELATPTPSTVELRWDDTFFPMALVRNPATGEVLSFARGGRVHLPATVDEIEILFSDGVRSPRGVRRQIR